MEIYDIKINQLNNPIGYQLEEISISWKIKGTKDKKQKSARIVVYKDINKKERVYDTGYTNLNSLGTSIDMRLEDKTRYYYQVSVHGENEKCESELHYFETGKDQEWKADFIAPVNKEHRKVILDFNCALEVKKARIYICGLGLYEAYINNEFVNQEYLTPGFHCYDTYLQYQTYNLISLLKKKNHLEIFLGEGWYRGRFGFDGGFTHIYGDKLSVIFEIHIEYVDGSSEIIYSNKTCKAQTSPICKDSIYDGEVYDANLIDHDSYGEVEVVTIDKEKLKPRLSLPIIEKERLMPINKIISPKGEVILDFGQNLTGWVDMEVEEDVKLSFCEILQDGCFYNDNYRTATFGYQYYGDGIRKKVRTHFTFYGFRYVKVECQKEININDYQACVITSDIKRIGYIETGHSKVNQLIQNVYWSQIDNFLDIPTDCPQRDERLGWSGDAQIFSKTACFNSDVAAFFYKYLYDMHCEQLLNDGGVPNIIPTIKPKIEYYTNQNNITLGEEVIEMLKHIDMSPWADAATIIPWNVYQSTGDVSFLKKTLKNMKMWVDHAIEKNASTGVQYLVDNGFHFADWLALDNNGNGPVGATDMYYVASIFFYYSTHLVAKALKVLKDQACPFYEAYANKIKEAIYNKYFENDILKLNTQTSYVLALHFNIVKEDMISYHAKQLVKKIKENHYHLDTGFVGTPFLNGVLSNTGHPSLAYDLLLNEEYPGWLYAVNLQATTIWERWNSVEPNGQLNKEGMNSLNHYAYGAILEWIYQYVCGIEALSAGYKKVKIHPYIDKRLKYVNMKYDSSAGEYVIRWVIERNKVILNVEIPFDCQATILMYDKQIALVESGKHEFILENV